MRACKRAPFLTQPWDSLARLFGRRVVGPRLLQKTGNFAIPKGVAGSAVVLPTKTKYSVLILAARSRLVYELCTSPGFSGPIRHFRLLKRL
jgi:hypothetical protein